MGKTSDWSVRLAAPDVTACTILICSSACCSALRRARPSDGAYSHAGEEFIFMLGGILENWLDELECHILREGDGFWFESNVGHRWFNPSYEEASLIWGNTPRTF